MNETANMFNESRMTVYRIWSHRKESNAIEEVLLAFNSRKKINCFRKSVDDDSIKELVQTAPLRRRKALRHTEEAIGNLSFNFL